MKEQREEEKQRGSEFKWNLAKFLIPAVGLPLMTLMFNYAIKAEGEKQRWEDYVPGYWEDINKDGLKDLVRKGLKGTEIWYYCGKDLGYIRNLKRNVK